MFNFKTLFSSKLNQQKVTDATQGQGRTKKLVRHKEIFEKRMAVKKVVAGWQIVWGRYFSQVETKRKKGKRLRREEEQEKGREQQKVEAKHWMTTWPSFLLYFLTSKCVDQWILCRSETTVVGYKVLNLRDVRSGTCRLSFISCCPFLVLVHS